jgi:hypothetical protein
MLKKLLNLNVLIGVFCILYGTISYATVMNVNSSSPASQYINGDNSYSGNFDINTALSGVNYNSPYDITYGSIFISFSDDEELGSLLQQYDLGVSTVDHIQNGAGTYTYREHEFDNYYAEDGEGVLLSTQSGNSVQELSAPGSIVTSHAYSDYELVYESRYCDHHILFISCTDWDVLQIWERDHDINNSITDTLDSLTLELALTSADLLDLSLDGILDFDVKARFGDFNLSQAYIRFDVEPNPSAAQAAASVPEPSIIFLFALGLVGIGFARRRRS